MRKQLAVGLLIVAVVGIWLALDLTDTHFMAVHQPDVDYDAKCDFSQTFNCTTVNASKYSSISLGEGRAELPISTPAVGFFALTGVIALWALFGGASEEEKIRKALAGLAALATIGVVFGLYLVWVQAVPLEGTWCPFCLALDGCTFATLGLAFFAHGGGIAGIKADVLPPDKGQAALGLVLLLAISGGAYGNYNSRVGAVEKKTLTEGGSSSPTEAATSHSEHDGHDHGEAPKSLDEMSPEEREAVLAESRTAITEFLGAHAKQERKEIPLNPFDGTKGNPDAKVTIVEWADFECPHCKQAAFFMQDIVQRYYDHVSFAFRNYPLGKPCNEAMSRNLHPMSCEAAWSVQCARRAGLFFDFHNQTFDAQGSLSTRRLTKIAEAVGMDKAAYQECVSRNDIRAEVVTQLTQGRDLGVRGTPAFFVNGRELLSIHPMAVEAAIRYELVEAGVDPTTLPPDPENLYPQ